MADDRYVQPQFEQRATWGTTFGGHPYVVHLPPSSDSSRSNFLIVMSTTMDTGLTARKEMFPHIFGVIIHSTLLVKWHDWQQAFWCCQASQSRCGQSAG